MPLADTQEDCLVYTIFFGLSPRHLSTRHENVSLSLILIQERKQTTPNSERRTYFILKMYWRVDALKTSSSHVLGRSRRHCTKGMKLFCLR